VSDWESSTQQRRQASLELYRGSGAANIIQRFYHAYKIRARLATLIFWHRFEIVIKIQKVARGFTIRRKMRRQIEKFKTILALRKKRVIILQSLYRGLIARRRVDALREKKEIQKQERRKRKIARLLRAEQESNSLEKKIYRFKRRIIPFRYILGAQLIAVVYCFTLNFHLLLL
jgi:hypothetical protein